MKKTKRLSVVIPAYNEKDIICEMLKECISSLEGIDYEIIIVDDGSLDGTYDKVIEFAKRYKTTRIINYGDNHGKGFAIRYGARFATGDMVAFIDADLNIHPRQIMTLVKKMEENDVDIVVGSKRHPESKIKYPINRIILSEFYYYFVKTLFGIPVRDAQVGLKLYKRKVVEDIFPIALVKRYAFDIEILANAHRMGYKMCEAPVEINMNFDSNINKKAIWNMFWDTCAVFYRMKLIHYYDKVNRQLYNLSNKN